MIFDNYEELKCEICEKEFSGRRPVDGGTCMCPDCIGADTLPVIDVEDEIPESVNEHIEGGEEDE